MNIIINNSSMKPIYEQIVDQIRSMIVEGSLEENAGLPSVRSLSRELRISALTVKKAYDCLEREGFIVTVHGKGSFVAAGSGELVQETRRREVESQLEMAIRAGRSCGMQDQELRELFELILEE